MADDERRATQANFEQMKKESPKHWGEQMRKIGLSTTLLASCFLFWCAMCYADASMRHQSFSMFWWWIGGGAFVSSLANATRKESEALSVLLARLDQPIEVPEIPSLPDLKITLAVEEELAELAEELHGAALPTKTQS